MYSINPDLIGTATPPIPEAGKWAAEFNASDTKPLINLAQGVPGSPPSAEFLERLSQAASDPKTTGYGSLYGDSGLRNALAHDVGTVYGGKVRQENVCLTAGCNMAFYAVLISLAQRGDEVILPSPWYFNHQMTLAHLGINPVPLPCAAPLFLPDTDTCSSLVTSKTRAIVLVTPNNPTGAVYPAKLIEQFALLAKSKNIALILDETYREFLNERPHDLFANSSLPWEDYLIHLFSFSKSYAIPGHRLGALVASPTLLDQLQKVMDCMIINPPRVAQGTVAWAIDGTRQWRTQIRDEMTEKRDIFTQGINSVDNWDIGNIGGYFAFVKHPFVGVASAKIAQLLAKHVGIVVLPGSFFSTPLSAEDDCYIRFSVANVSTDVLQLVPARLKEFNELAKSLDFSV